MSGQVGRRLLSLLSIGMQASKKNGKLMAFDAFAESNKLLQFVILSKGEPLIEPVLQVQSKEGTQNPPRMVSTVLAGRPSGGAGANTSGLDRPTSRLINTSTRAGTTTKGTSKHPSIRSLHRQGLPWYVWSFENCIWHASHKAIWLCPDLAVPPNLSDRFKTARVCTSVQAWVLD